MKGYETYKYNWIKEHINPETLYNEYLQFLLEKINNDSNETFENYLFNYGFKGEIYVSYDEYINNEYNEEEW